MIDLVYPLGPGSRNADLELYHSLRLVKKFCTGYRNIYIIGEVPPPDVATLWPWPQHPVIHHPHENKGRNRQDCIRKKLEYACTIPELSSPFLAMNDDYFFTRPTNLANYPFYYYSTVGHAYNIKRKSGHYKRALLNTVVALAAAGLPNRYYDVHMPMQYHRATFLQIMQQYNWAEQDGFVIKSLYGNNVKLCHTTGIARPDCNINHYTNHPDEITALIPPGRELFAVGENGFNPVMQAYIESL